MPNRSSPVSSRRESVTLKVCVCSREPRDRARAEPEVEFIFDQGPALPKIHLEALLEPLSKYLLGFRAELSTGMKSDWRAALPRRVSLTKCGFHPSITSLSFNSFYESPKSTKSPVPGEREQSRWTPPNNLTATARRFPEEGPGDRS